MQRLHRRSFAGRMVAEPLDSSRSSFDTKSWDQFVELIAGEFRISGSNSSQF
jgi:hypothetical protein